jgi:hypothetical protein
LNKKLNRRGRGARRGKNIKRFKAQGSGRKGKNGAILKASRNARTPKGLSEKDLCVLRLLLVSPLVLMRGGSGARKSLTPKRRKETQTAEIREDAERGKYA